MATKKPALPLEKYIPKEDKVIYFYKGIRLMLVPWVYVMPDYGYLKLNKCLK